MAGFGQAAGVSWAKVQLTRGQSSGGVWEIDGKYPQARLSIGADPAAGWAVQGPGVRPMHFELYWDGKHLFVADTQRAGQVTLNGLPVGSDWVQVRGRGEVAFGQAAMLVETSDATPAATPPPADANGAKRVSMAGGPPNGGGGGLPELSGEATRLADSPWESGGQSGAMSGEATRIQEAPSELGPPGMGVPKPAFGAPAAPGSRPRLGGEGGPGYAAPTLMQDELAASVAEATRMVSMPDNGPSIVVAPGLMPQQPMGQPMQPMGGGYGAPQGQSFGAPQGQQQQQQQPFGAPSAPGPGGFAAPPSFDAAGAPLSGGSKLPFGLTPRLAAMVGALGIAVIVLLFIGFADDDYVEAPVPAVAPPVAPPPVGVAPPVAPPPVGVAPPVAPLGVPPVAPVAPLGVPPVAPQVGAPPVAPLGVPPVAPLGVPPVAPPVAVAPPVPVAPVPVAPTPVAPTVAVDPSIPLPPTPERMAADLVIAGHYTEALPQYQTLAMQHPERPEYSAMVHILEARIRAAQCSNGVGPDGRPCVR